jgi:hypothetical protein
MRGKPSRKISPPKYALFCSFCGKPQIETAKLVVGRDASICRECVMLCNELAELPMVIQAMTGPVMLGAAPIGLFINDFGDLCLKTEYRTEKGAVEAYIVESGEFFWGAAPQTVESQLQQKVTPVAIRLEATDAR